MLPVTSSCSSFSLHVAMCRCMHSLQKTCSQEWACTGSTNGFRQIGHLSHSEMLVSGSAYVYSSLCARDSEVFLLRWLDDDDDAREEGLELDAMPAGPLARIRSLSCALKRSPTSNSRSSSLDVTTYWRGSRPSPSPCDQISLGTGLPYALRVATRRMRTLAPFSTNLRRRPHCLITYGGTDSTP